MTKAVVIVEEDAVVGEQLRSALGAEGFAVHVAACGRDALYMLVELGGDPVVVLDRRIPDLGGWDLLEWLRCIGSRSPVIALFSADATVDPPGVTASLGTPVPVDALVRLLHAYV